MKSRDLGWLAGLFEGEAYFGASVKDDPRIIVSSTDEDVLQRIVALVGGNIIGPYAPRVSATGVQGKKPFWQWRLNKNREVSALLMTLYPLMGERRQARIRALLLTWRQRPRRGLKTHCKRGHPFDEANTYLKGGQRECLTCKRVKARLWHQKQRASRFTSGHSS